MSFAAYAGTRDPSGDAVTTTHGGASVRHSQIRHLRPSPFSLARIGRDSIRDELGDDGLQLKTHAEPDGRSGLENSSCHSLIHSLMEPYVISRAFAATPI